MKKRLLTSLLFLASVTVLTAQITLSFNPGKGSKYQYHFTSKQDIKQNVMGQDFPMKQNMVMVYDMDIVEKGKESVKAAFTYREVFYEISSAMMNVKYDSKSEIDNSNPMNEIMAKIFSGLLNKQFEATIAPDGSVLSVTGMEAILEGMTAALGDDAQAAAIGEGMKQQLSNEAMKNTFEQSMKIYPKEKIKVGSTWNVEQNVATTSGNMNINSVYELKSTDKKNASVEVKSKVEGMNGQLTGVQTGTLEFDVKSGITKSSNIVQEMKGNMTVQGMEVSMEISSTNIVIIKEL